MPETKTAAKKRAKKRGIPVSNVVKADDDEYFIAPAGVTKAAAKKAYANCRAKGGSKEKCAKISHTVNKKAKKK